MRHVRTLLLVLALTGLSAPAAPYDFSTYEQITVAATSIGITAAVRAPQGQNAVLCIGRVETAQIRFRDDGTAPTATVGEVLEIGDVIRIEGQLQVRLVRFIRTGSSSGTLNVRCYR